MTQRTDIEIEFPPSPKLTITKDQQDFDRWYIQLQESIRRQFEQLAEVVDGKQNSQ